MGKMLSDFGKIRNLYVSKFDSRKNTNIFYMQKCS